jgi:hypothetical protein
LPPPQRNAEVSPAKRTASQASSPSKPDRRSGESSEENKGNSLFGLLVRCDRSFQSSVLPHSLEKLTAAKHAFDLDRGRQAQPITKDGMSNWVGGVGGGRGDGKEDNKGEGTEKVHLHLDPWMMGLGGDDSWSPRVHAEYLIDTHKKPPNKSSRSRTDDADGGAYESTFWLTALAPEEAPQAAATFPVADLRIMQLRR